jgi:hypothetical protein
MRRKAARSRSAVVRGAGAERRTGSMSVVGMYYVSFENEVF